MSRFLFVVPPFAAHVNPSVSIGRMSTHEVGGARSAAMALGQRN